MPDARSFLRLSPGLSRAALFRDLFRNPGEAADIKFDFRPGHSISISPRISPGNPSWDLLDLTGARPPNSSTRGHRGPRARA